jgi:predicted nucleic acid-binding protein
VVLIDTNVLAYLLIEGDRTAAAQELYARDSDWRSEAFALVEFSNFLATQIHAKALTREQGTRLLVGAQALIREPISVPHVKALETAAEFGISAYDARFIALAMQMKLKLITEDARLRTAVPTWTVALTATAG